MPRVGFIAETGLIDRHDTIEDPDLLRAVTPFAESPSDLDLEGFLELALVPVQILVSAERREVIAMDDNGDVSGGMVEHTRIAYPNGEANPVEHLSVSVLPQLASVASPIHAPYLAGNSAGRQSEFLRDSHEDSPFRQSIKVSFPDVDKRQSKRLPLTLALTDVLGEKHPLTLERRGGCTEEVILFAVVQLATDESGANIGRGGISLVAQNPPGSDEDVVRDGLHLVDRADFPDLGVEIVELVLNRGANEGRLEHLTGVLIEVASAEVRLLVSDR